MKDYYFDFLSALFAVVSAFYWARSARVQFNFNYDMGEENNKAMTKSSKLNATAAALAALAAVVQAAKPAWDHFIGFVS